MPTNSFVHDTLGQRVVLEAGGAAKNLAAEVSRLGADRIMLIASDAEADLADRVAAGLPVALRWTEVIQHVPVELAERAREAAASAAVDLLVPVGGGSTTGLAKAIALSARVPIVAVPTTYAGSEATAVWGLTEGRHKTTGVHPSVLPVTVVYDSTLTLSLPVGLSVASGFNALAHCVDSMWASGSDPINRTLALEGIRVLAAGLPKVVADPSGIEGRDECLYGAYLSAVAFASAGSGLHHKICHVLGGTYNLPHAETHAVVLPHVLALNAPAVPEIGLRIGRALGGDEPVAALERLRASVGAPRALKDAGFDEADIRDAAARILPVVPPSNPGPVDRRVLEALLRAAWAGETPVGAA
ncbi:maleylacetate reductase [Actinoplanes aureus]|uniref:Maleylacetate reductase n=1 Tax=Actinoplanes aureus TaxID=2792083 RepID=A0A931CD69_9ACTN|nr:maleylacetate reductase [Actinoplanes aureus]MBG0562735.1 maleylacetate reductase [Actinoplanes aureus]